MDPWLELFARTNLVRSADTAHDLKTPLNVAVLNLELLRMRMRKLLETEDPKAFAYMASIEGELRRMGRIFDAFFLLTAPPKNEEPPETIDIAPLIRETWDLDTEPFHVAGHESRIRQALKLFSEGAASVLEPEERRASVQREERRLDVVVTGRPRAADFEITKIFKFYYSDPDGNPDLCLASARLIAETYGGELIAAEESDKVSIRISFPGEK